MALRIAFFVGPLLFGMGSALLLNAAGAGPVLAIAVYAGIAAILGVAIAVLGSQIPELLRWPRNLARGVSHKS